MYKKIKEIRVEDFRNIGNVVIDFNDSPIISLVGDNESGKTSIVKAFAVCALNAYAMEQKSFIRDGTQEFNISIVLEDGTIITRTKSNIENKYTIIYPDGTIESEDRLGTNESLRVSQLMGMVKEPETGEYLNIRTYEDKLLFVVTPASVNYKVMYNALKVENLTRAINKGLKEVNNIESDIRKNNVSIDQLNNELGNLKVYDIEPLLNIRKRLKSQLQNLNKLKKIVEIKKGLDNSKSKLGNLGLIYSEGLEEIDLGLVSKVSSAYNLMLNLRNSQHNLNKIESVASLREININLIYKMSSLYNLLVTLKKTESKLNKVKEVSSLNEIDVSLLDKANRVLILKRQLDDLYKKYSKVNDIEAKEIGDNIIDVLKRLEKLIEVKSTLYDYNSKLDKLNQAIQKIEKYFKENDISITECPRCGETIVLNN